MTTSSHHTVVANLHLSSVARADFTLINFFFTYTDEAATDSIGYLVPSDLMTPTQAAFEAALLAVGFEDIEVQSAPVFKNIQNSFGLFLDGTVYDEDIPKFLSVLQMFWRTQQGTKYQNVTCVNGFIEKYFTSIET